MAKASKWAVWIVLVSVAGISLAIWLYRQVQIDKCLDAGGRWEYQERHCLFEVPKK